MSYSYMGFFQALYKSLPPDSGCQAADTGEFELWKTKTRSHLNRLLGIPLLEQLQPLYPDFSGEVRLLDTVQEEGYTRYTMEMDTLPHVCMPFHLLIPEAAASSPPCRAMIALPAHGASKDTVAGIISGPEAAEKLLKTPAESYGKTFVQKGYVVCCPDTPGFGERREPISMEDEGFNPGVKGNPLSSSCKDLTMTAEALGLTFAGLALWDLKKLLDFMTEHPLVDAGRIGCCGFSGGGLYTLWLAAMDDRIKAAMVSGYLHGYYDSILNTHLCPCNFVPELWRHYDVSDLASLIAPRPLFFENGTEDILNGPRGITDPEAQYEKIRQVYRLFSKDNLVRHQRFKGPHRFEGTGMDFMDSVL